MSRCDGTGINPAVNEKDVGVFVRLIQDRFGPQGKVVDFGTGLGYLPMALNEAGFEALGIEGAASLADKKVCRDEHWMCLDLTERLPLEFKDRFDLSVSFEFMEHVEREHQEQLWENILFCSPRHLFSVNQDDSLEGHCFAQPREYWVNLFYRMDMKCEEFPIPDGIGWFSTLFFDVSRR